LYAWSSTAKTGVSGSASAVVPGVGATDSGADGATDSAAGADADADADGIADGSADADGEALDAAAELAGGSEARAVVAEGVGEGS
jgi:hypothetical protein